MAGAKRHLSQLPGVRIRLADVGRALGISPVHDGGLFREVEGMPFYRYALQQRVERAVRLLPGYGGDLSALALRTRFCEPQSLHDCVPSGLRMHSRDLP